MTTRHRKPKRIHQISVGGLMGYTFLWATVISLFSYAASLQAGTHTIAEARLADTLILIATGLVFVAIGTPLAIILGKGRHAVGIAFTFFLVGFTAIPVLVVIMVILASFGVIDLD